METSTSGHRVARFPHHHVLSNGLHGPVSTEEISAQDVVLWHSFSFSAQRPIESHRGGPQSGSEKGNRRGPEISGKPRDTAYLNVNHGLYER